MKQSECNRLEGLKTRETIRKACIGKWKVAVGIARQVGRTRAMVLIHLKALQKDGRMEKREVRVRLSGYPRREWRTIE